MASISNGSALPLPAPVLAWMPARPPAARIGVVPAYRNDYELPEYGQPPPPPPPPYILPPPIQARADHLNQRYRRNPYCVALTCAAAVGAIVGFVVLGYQMLSNSGGGDGTGTAGPWRL